MFEGAASYEVVVDPGGGSRKLTRYMDYEPPGADYSNTPPVYPPCLVNLGLAPQQIVVRLIIGADGAVVSSQPSSIPCNCDQGYRAEFEAAVATAVQTWQFSPATLKRFENGPDSNADGKPDYVVMKANEPVQSHMDLRFTFEVREGKPDVGVPK